MTDQHRAAEDVENHPEEYLARPRNPAPLLYAAGAALLLLIGALIGAGLVLLTLA